MSRQAGGQSSRPVQVLRRGREQIDWGGEDWGGMWCWGGQWEEYWMW